MIENNALVLVKAATGFVTSVFRSDLPDEVECETVHAAFCFPVESDITRTINWNLSNYDLIIIDELSMIPDTIFQHVMKTLNVLLFRPVVMLCGDVGQQQPFSRQMSKIMQIKSAFNNTCFINNTYHYHLIGQHRVGDPHYLSFFTTIRKWIPTQQLLGQIQHGRVLTKDHNITDQVIYDVYFSNPENTFLTFTKKCW